MPREAQPKADEESITDWGPIHVINRDVSGPTRGLYTIRLTLSEWPDQDWSRLFAGPPLAGNQPEVQNRIIVWEVPKSDLKDAYGLIKDRIDVANTGYQQILAKRIQQRKQADDKEAAARAELASLKKELDGFKF
jgi:hypothetical protein